MRDRDWYGDAVQREADKRLLAENTIRDLTAERDRYRKALEEIWRCAVAEARSAGIAVDAEDGLRDAELAFGELAAIAAAALEKP